MYKLDFISNFNAPAKPDPTGMCNTLCLFTRYWAVDFCLVSKYREQFLVTMLWKILDVMFWCKQQKERAC